MNFSLYEWSICSLPISLLGWFFCLFVFWCWTFDYLTLLVCCSLYQLLQLFACKVVYNREFRMRGQVKLTFSARCWWSNYLVTLGTPNIMWPYLHVLNTCFSGDFEPVADGKCIDDFIRHNPCELISFLRLTKGSSGEGEFFCWLVYYFCFLGRHSHSRKWYKIKYLLFL